MEMKNISERSEELKSIWKIAHPRADAARGVCHVCMRNEGKAKYIIGTTYVGSMGRRLHLYDENKKGLCGHAGMGKSMYGKIAEIGQLEEGETIG